MLDVTSICKRRSAVVWTGALLMATTCAALVLASQPTVEPPALNQEVLAFIEPIATADGDSELSKKQKERHNAAVDLLQARVDEYRSGSREIGAVFEAARMVAESKLDLADSPEARVRTLEQTFHVAKLIEARLQTQLDKGFGSKGDLARARLARLSVEVELLRAKGDKP